MCRPLSQVEVLAHWLGHLRAGGEEEAALEQAGRNARPQFPQLPGARLSGQVQALSRFWLGSSAGRGLLCP